MSDNEIQELDRSIDIAQEILEMGNALERLSNNRDFKAVITHGFFEKEAIRLVHLKSDASMQTAERQTSIMKQMDAIGTLAGYFQLIYRNANLSAKTLEADKNMREALLSSGE